MPPPVAASAAVRVGVTAGDDLDALVARVADDYELPERDRVALARYALELARQRDARG